MIIMIMVMIMCISIINIIINIVVVVIIIITLFKRFDMRQSENTSDRLLSVNRYRQDSTHPNDRGFIGFVEFAALRDPLIY